MASRRQETKDDKRGSALSRRRRKDYLLSAPQFGGDGTTVPCVHCKTRVTRAELHCDRIIPGGSYRRSNVQPSCPPCNIKRGNKIDWRPQPALAVA